MARILVVDDEEQVRRFLKRILDRTDHDVVEAKDGDEAVDLARTLRPDLLITDLFMPNREGLETIQEFRTMYPAIKIIVISGGGRTNNLDFLSVAERFGAERAIQKPFEAAEILDAIEELLGGVVDAAE